MTSEPPSVVIPSIHLPQGKNGVRGGLGDLPLRRHPLPLAALLEPRHGSLRYAITTVDHSGRIADRSVIRSLSWHAAIRLAVYEQHDLIIVRPDNRGSHAMNGRGFLAIPSAVRRWCGLTAGERLMLVGDPVGQVLVLHPPKALDRVVGAAHLAALGGDDV